MMTHFTATAVRPMAEKESASDVFRI